MSFKKNKKMENEHSLSASNFIMESMRRYQQIQTLYGKEKGKMTLEQKSITREDLIEKAYHFKFTTRFAFQDEEEARVKRKRITSSRSGEVN